MDAYYAGHQAFPASLREAGFDAALPPEVAGIRVSPDTSAIGITLGAPVRPLQSKSVFLEPTPQGQRLSWRCTSIDIAPKYLPGRCRQ